jgi:D-arabinose 1-dehydrogenase-like Zn-dependent alcohol dehydrogenase
VISSMKMTEERIQEVLRMCSERQIAVKRMRITMEDLTEPDQRYYSLKK